MFVGRAAELRRLEELTSSGARLITLWGPGGAGKTTLARRVAGTTWVELASARTRSDVLAAFATTLNVDADEGAIRRALETRGTRIVADNVEQVDAEGRALLVSLPVPMLVTSRDALGVEGEVAIEVTALPADEAVALYTQLSGTSADDDARAIVTRLDALPLAIELAAARAPLLGSTALRARLEKSFDVLKDTSRVPRHATLRAAIAWSWDLLDDAERDALVVCAQFEAPFDAALAEAAVGDDALDPLDALRKRALLHADAPRLRLFESVRAFAREKGAMAERGEPLAPSDPAFAREGGTATERYARAVVARVEPLARAVRCGEAVDDELLLRRADLLAIGAAVVSVDLRARALLALAALQSVTGPHDFGREIVFSGRTSQVEISLAGPHTETSLVETRVVPGQKNLITATLGGDAARERAQRVDVLPNNMCMLGGEPVDGDLALRLVVAKGVAARAAGRLDEAEAAAAWALSAAPDDAHALRLAGMVARARGRESRELLERALAAFRATGEEAFAGLTLGEIGAALQSVKHLAEGIAILVATKSVRAEGLLRSHLAVLTHRRGDPRDAVKLHEAALAIHRRVGNRRLEGAELLHLGFVRHEIAEVDAAWASFEQARRTLAEAGAVGLEALACVFRARLDVDASDLVAARIALAEASRSTPPGWHRLQATRFLVAGHLALAEGDRAAAVVAYDEALAASRDVEVGFEALTPAYRAFAAGEPAPETPAFANPHLAHAFAILTGATTTAPSEAIASSSEVRRAIAFAGKRSLIITSANVILPDGRTIDLSKRKSIRLVLATMAAARTWVDADTLIAAGWPGERMRADAATKRLHTAIWTLRKLGLEGILQSSETGYRLNPDIALELRTDM